MSYSGNKYFNAFSNNFSKRTQQTAGTNSDCYVQTGVLSDGSGTYSASICPNSDGTYSITITKMYEDGTSTYKTYFIVPNPSGLYLSDAPFGRNVSYTVL